MTQDETRGVFMLVMCTLLVVYVLLYSPPYPTPRPIVPVRPSCPRTHPNLENQLANIEALLIDLIKKSTDIPIYPTHGANPCWKAICLT